MGEAVLERALAFRSEGLWSERLLGPSWPILAFFLPGRKGAVGPAGTQLRSVVCSLPA